MVVVVGVDKFEDPTFDLEKRSNQIGDNVAIYRPPENYVFIRNGIRESDINQGALGSCWLLSTIGSFAARYDQTLLENVLNVKFNQKNGPREGKLVFRFYRFNKFEDVIIDDRLPLVEHEMAVDSRDWWVPLIEKAYAKFYDSYRNIDGGYPRVSSFNLTGGVCVDINSDKLTPRLYTTLSRLVVELYQTGRVCLTCGNKGDRQGHARMEMGIVPWHAYSVLTAKRASTKDGKSVYLIQIRNPHGFNSDEWRGRWSDRDVNRWSTLSDEEEFHNERDGTFWMEMSEFFDYFELMTICLLPTTWSDQHQIDIYGVFDEGLNVPYDTYTKQMMENNLQFLLVIPPEKAPDVELWMQLVLDLHELRDFPSKKVSLNIYGQSSTQRLDLKYMKSGGYRKVPLLPLLDSDEAYNTEEYDINGHLYGRLPSGNYIITVSCVGIEGNEDLQRINFKLRLVSKYGQIIDLNPDPNITVEPSYKEIKVANKSNLPKRKRKRKPGFCCL